MISSQTHEQGKVLNLVLTNKPNLIREVIIIDQHDVCHSDHYGVTFKLNVKAKRVINKRKFITIKKLTGMASTET